VKFGIIAGGKKNDKGYNPLIDADNDGEVRVDETYLKGAKDFIILEHAHTPMYFIKIHFNNVYILLKMDVLKIKNISNEQMQIRETKDGERRS